MIGPEALSTAPVALALVAASLFGMGGVTAKRGLAHIDAHTAAIVALGTTLAVYVLLSPWWMRSSDWFTTGFWVFVLNGLIHPMLSMYFALQAHARTDPTVAATFSSTAPLFAALTAVLFLGESITVLVAVGTLITIVGVMALSWSPGGITRFMGGTLLFATGAAVIRGLNHTVGKWGLDLLPNIFMAGFVSFAVALCGSLALYRIRRGHLPRRIAASGLRYFVLTGVLTSVAVLCMYGALAAGRVVIVSPVIATYPIFTLLTAVAVRQEALTVKLLSGVLLVVGGVVMISTGA